MASYRKNVFDFIAQVNAQTPGAISKAVYAATLSADGTVKITKNGVVLWARVLWAQGVGQAITDANISGDGVTLFGAENSGAVGPSDAQLFINSLT